MHIAHAYNYYFALFVISRSHLAVHCCNYILYSTTHEVNRFVYYVTYCTLPLTKFGFAACNIVT